MPFTLDKADGVNPLFGEKSREFSIGDAVILFAPSEDFSSAMSVKDF
jgi:hypothetical protein